ncbi:MAG: hypothetical protein RLZZ04_2635 [Cyanobacteriota bacterium]
MVLDFFPASRYLGLMVATIFSGVILTMPQIAQAQAPPSGAITLKADVQESNAKTGVTAVNAV